MGWLLPVSSSVRMATQVRRLVLLISITGFILGAATNGRAAELTLLCGISESWPAASCHDAAKRFEDATDHSIQVIEADVDPTVTLRHLRELLAVESPAIDVIQLDIIWPAVLGPYLADLGRHAASFSRQQIDAMRNAGSFQGRTVALPLFADVGVLYFRSDMLGANRLDPPQTWDELRETALKMAAVAGDRGQTLEGYLFAGEPGEALISNLLEWSVSIAGAEWLDDGTLRINTPELKAMLEELATWIGEAAPRANLQADEEVSIARFARGRSAYMRHWASAAPQIYAASPAISAVTDIMPLPAQPERDRAGTLGGGMVGVSAFSAEPEAAIALALHLASRDEQDRRARENGLLPSDTSLLAGVAKDHPQSDVMTIAASLLQSAVSRPATHIGPGYARFSEEFGRAVHAIISGDIEADEGLDALQLRLERMSGGGQRW